MKLGEHTDAAIKNGGQLLVKQAMPGKWIFNAQITFANGKGYLGNISTTTVGALENLESTIMIKTGG